MAKQVRKKMRTIAAVTTMNQEYYDTIGHRLIDTFIKYWPKEVKLYVFTENFVLPVSAPNIIVKDLYTECNPGLQNFLDWRGKHFTRKFAYKAYCWINACKTLPEDVLMYLDADTETKKEVSFKWLLSVLPEDQLMAYMHAIAEITEGDKLIEVDNAETCIYWFNNKHSFAKQFMNDYEHIYESREISNNKIYVKPHDTWVVAECVRRAEKNNVGILNLHPAKDRRTPLKKTILHEYFSHYKGKSKFYVED
jgi:hypothetical protein